MLTRAQKDDVWDIFPASFDVEVIDSSELVTFTKDTATTDNDVQVIETFQPEEVRYPSIQIQYANADTRVNFMNFQHGDERGNEEYQDFGTSNGSINILNNPITADLTIDPSDITSKLEFRASMPTNSDSYMRVQLFQDSGQGVFKLVTHKDYYTEEMGDGNTLAFYWDLYPGETYRLKFNSYSTGPNNLGVLVEVDVNEDPLIRYYRRIYYTVYGNVENIIISLRVIAEDKLVYRQPGEGYYVEAQDIVDAILKQVSTAFFELYDSSVRESSMVKIQNQYDVTDIIASGTQERLAARQMDILVTNNNKLRKQYVTPTAVDLTILNEVDRPSDTL